MDSGLAMTNAPRLLGYSCFVSCSIRVLALALSETAGDRALESPGSIAVAKVDSFADARVARPEKFENRTGARIAQVLFLQLDERAGAGVVVVRQIEGKLSASCS